MTAPLLAAAAAAAALAQAQADTLHQYRDLALSPDGARMASVEVDEALETPGDPHAAIVVRRARDGSVLERIDPCSSCSYSALAWSPDGAKLAFVAGDFATRSYTLEAAAAGKIQAIAKVQGVAGAARWSPDGTRLGWLVTPGARKRSGAVEAGAAQVGEIGAENDEQ